MISVIDVPSVGPMVSPHVEMYKRGLEPGEQIYYRSPTSVPWELTYPAKAQSRRKGTCLDTSNPNHEFAIVATFENMFQSFWSQLQSFHNMGAMLNFSALVKMFEDRVEFTHSR